MPRFAVSTTKTLHRPVEVEIDGVLYTVRLNKASFEALRDIEKKLRTIEVGKPDFDSIFLLYDEVVLFTGAPMELVAKIDFHDLQELVYFVMKAYYGKEIELTMVAGTANPPGENSTHPIIKGEDAEKDDEKNSSGPGANQSAT
jgi:hypothetical protein